MALGRCARDSGKRPADGSGARIVSLIPATTEMLFAIGAGERVVGVRTSTDFRRGRRAAARRRTDRSRYRADPRAPAGSGRRLQHAGRVEVRARSCRLSPTSRTSIARCRTSWRPFGRSAPASASAARGASPSPPRWSERSRRVRQRCRRPPRPRTLLVFGRERRAPQCLRERRLRISRRPAGRRGWRQRLRRRQAAVGEGAPR